MIVLKKNFGSENFPFDCLLANVLSCIRKYFQLNSFTVLSVESLNRRPSQYSPGYSPA